MLDILDNPIWHALHTGNRSIAYGSDSVKYIQRDTGLFAGLANNDEAELQELAEMLPTGSRVILFTAEEIKVPQSWEIALKRPLLQMVHERVLEVATSGIRIIPLTDEHIPAMLALTALTKPGPFLERTIDFGHYEGVFDGDRLVAMTGQRLQPDPYTEVSAVCTHPDHTGRGYAAALIQSQLVRLRSNGRIPFLHCYPDNTPAISVYKRLGFIARKELVVYMIWRN